MNYALENTAVIVQALEHYFDVPYPFDKLDLLAAPDFSFGAMENAGLIVYRDSLLLGVEKAPTQLRQAYWGTHTHELAHQWFGNLVTMPWWDDIWLNEAFATWMASKIVHQLKPDPCRTSPAAVRASRRDRRQHRQHAPHPRAGARLHRCAFGLRRITYQRAGWRCCHFRRPRRGKFRAGVRAHSGSSRAARRPAPD